MTKPRLGLMMFWFLVYPTTRTLTS